MRRELSAPVSDAKTYPRALDVLLAFRGALLCENLILSDMDVSNQVVQFDAPDRWRVRIIDGVGSPAWLPVYYYIDFLGARFVRRHWRRCIRRTMERYPALFTDEEAARLLDV